MSVTKESKVAFAIVKLKVKGVPHFLMRMNRSWGDISFVGGHINDRDVGSPKRAAYRELLEEVPTLRRTRNIDLEPLTSQVTHGPVFSRSALTTVRYELYFFQVTFRNTPEPAISSLTQRSLNILVSQRDLINPTKFKVASLVELLNREYQGGLSSIPYSWPGNLNLSSVSGKHATLAHQ